MNLFSERARSLDDLLSRKIRFVGPYSEKSQKFHSKKRRLSDVGTNDSFDNTKSVSEAKPVFSEKNSIKKSLKMNWDSAGRIGPGLDNLGNTCFLNSVLQILTYTPPLAMYALSGNDSRTCQSQTFCVLCEFQKHVNLCIGPKRTNSPHITPKAIVSRLYAIAKHLKVGRQEDSHEFLRYFLEALQNSGLSSSDRKSRQAIESTIIFQIFGGRLHSLVQCLSCKHKSITQDPFMDLSLELRNCDSLQACLAQFTKAEILNKGNQYRCEKCAKLVDAKKRITIGEAPAVLTIQLKRFDFGFMMGTKINKHIAFDEILELSPYMNDKSRVRYNLVGVLVHDGNSCKSGHYYSFVKSSAGVWHCMNDSQADTIPEQQISPDVGLSPAKRQKSSHGESAFVSDYPKTNGTGLANGVLSTNGVKSPENRKSESGKHNSFVPALSSSKFYNPPGNQVLGVAADVGTWEGVSDSVIDIRENVAKNNEKKMRRPDTWDQKYDEGKISKKKNRQQNEQYFNRGDYGNRGNYGNGHHHGNRGRGGFDRGGFRGGNGGRRGGGFHRGGGGGFHRNNHYNHGRGGRF
ncbi:Ubiquitin carboxyl-terminal hydrolase 36 [Nowakowskiella sp. JEL0407]|nr:Ubiquitin carboxyl-terminal hydrolase 36 [Nowakowskiella sp. JEL0407]